MAEENEDIQNKDLFEAMLSRFGSAIENIDDEFFDEKNIDIAVKVMFCESRMKSNAYRWQANDSGLFQIIPQTWGWVKEKYNIPYWDYPIGNNYAQFIPKYNIKVAALLVQNMHTRDNYWKPWDSSKWCWGNNKTFENIWRSEQY